MVRTFAYDTRSELARRLQDDGADPSPPRVPCSMPASDRQSGFHHSFFEPIFCFSPGPAVTLCAASGAPHSSVSAPPPPASTVVSGFSVSTLVIRLWLLNYRIYPRILSAKPFLESPFFPLAINVSESTADFQPAFARRSLSAPTHVAPTKILTYSVTYETCLPLRTFFYFILFLMGHSYEDGSKNYYTSLLELEFSQQRSHSMRYAIAIAPTHQKCVQFYSLTFPTVIEIQTTNDKSFVTPLERMQAGRTIVKKKKFASCPVPTFIS
jgi:hypothetical protein